MRYNNPTAPMVDNSGFTIFYTSTPKTYEIGLLILGEYVEDIEIPPNATAYKISNICPNFCLEKNLNNSMITLVGSYALANNFTQSTTTIEALANFENMDDVMTIPFYDVTIRETIAITPYIISTSLEMSFNCIYNTTTTTNTIYGGTNTSTQEQCLNIIYYYPKIPSFTECRSIKNTGRTPSSVNASEVLWRDGRSTVSCGGLYDSITQALIPNCDDNEIQQTISDIVNVASTCSDCKTCMNSVLNIITGPCVDAVGYKLLITYYCNQTNLAACQNFDNLLQSCNGTVCPIGLGLEYCPINYQCSNYTCLSYITGGTTNGLTPQTILGYPLVESLIVIIGGSVAIIAVIVIIVACACCNRNEGKEGGEEMKLKDKDSNQSEEEKSEKSEEKNGKNGKNGKKKKPKDEESEKKSADEESEKKSEKKKKNKKPKDEESEKKSENKEKSKEESEVKSDKKKKKNKKPKDEESEKKSEKNEGSSKSSSKNG